MIAFLLTPIGRYIAIAIVVIMAISGVYWSIRSDAVSDYRAKENTEALEKVNDAINAGDAVSRDSSGLRRHDAFERE